MRHLLPSAAALFLAFWTLSAAALGLGEMSVESGLNQRFVARIPLSLTAADDPSAVRIALASNAEFERAGLERSAFLSDLRFEVVADGAAPHVRVTSDQIAREPIVMLLVEARDTSSRVLREYTVFLDPPYFGPGTPAEVGTPVPVAATPLATPPPTPVPAPASVKAPAATAVPQVAVPATTTPAPATQQTSPQFYETVEESAQPSASVPAPVPTRAASVVPDSAPSRSEFGPVAAGQTLWSIAGAVLPDSSVTMDQMLLALYRSNPDAFDGGINGLQKGAVLRVPSRDEITAVSPDAARLEVRRLRGLERPAPTRSPKPTPAPSVMPTALPTPEPTLDEASKPTTSGPISLPAKPAATPAPQPTSAAELSPDLPIVEPSDAVSAQIPAETETSQAAASVEGESAAPNEAPATAEPSATPAPAVAVEQDEIVSGPLPKREAGLLETLLIPLILGLLVLGGIGYLISRILARRKAGADSAAAAPGSIPKPPSTPRPVAPVADAAPEPKAEPEPPPASTQQFELPQTRIPGAAAGLAMDATQAFNVPPPAEPEPVDFDLTGQFESQTMQIDLDTNDPVSEADFHLAYGLYDEAALLLKQAAEREPGRSEIRTKLAETYFAAGKPAEFLAAAEDAHPLVSAADWQKISIMGQQLCPDVELFHEGSAVADVGGATDFDLGALDEAPAEAVEPVAESPSDLAETRTDSSSLDFKLDDFNLPAVEPAASETTASAHDNALEFDLSQFDLSQPGEAESAAVADTARGGGAADNAVDFELDLSSFDTAAENAPSEPALETAAEAELPTLDIQADAPKPTGALNEIDFSLGDIEVSEPAPSNNVPEIRLDDIDLGEMPTESAAAGDEVGTKLDLARAYVDMGDSEMARSLLDEVVAQGSDQQKQDAQNLLSRLG
ncbi:hypothetical protein E4T66_08435 [Sinimarinibacterium sp. CAU 1509]|uniref:FimV/HubP family polar landmark protein n=1 Tax=Sinimarinibacterium sp. CAU 1509 TaxID=2562283 RepID=UPI0010AD1347|nr:FimV/HubP family polar landmark protein [Sinimarinibacterium sp. CAU 1509]TJY62239.1 hypothetical protein E4T66_08435 [Sinimarinibacterium sp. CAU 1509]